MTASWGSGASGVEGDGEHVPGSRIDLGGGHSMVLNPEAIRALLHSPQAVAGITARANAIKNSAQELSKHVGRPGRPDPEYTIEVENNPADTRARARVRPGNVQAVISNAINSDLLKAMDSHPSDPREHEV